MVPEWQIERDEFLRRLDCSETSFRKRLCLPNIRQVRRILPLRNLREIDSVIPMRFDMLYYLISKMTTLEGERPFVSAEIQICKMDPNHLKIGQKFVYRENYQAMLEDLPCIFSKFAIATGFSDLGAYFIFGRDEEGVPAMACYIPPFIEQHGKDLVVMDGIHRNFLNKQLGTTLKTILLTGVTIPFPCGMRPWAEVRVISVEAKPRNINDRYFDLAKGRFRDLKYLGIDG